MAEAGTSLEDLETGKVDQSADSDHMAAIIREMNASGAHVDSGASKAHMQQMQHMQHMPPMQGMQPMPPMMPGMGSGMGMPAMPPMPNYVHVDEDAAVEYRPKKKNLWSSVIEQVRDPIFIAVLVFVLSLPVLHTFIGKYASWAFAVGGQLSWLGLILKSVLAGLLFGVYRLASALF